MLLDETVTLKKPSHSWRWIAFGTLTVVALFAATLTLGSISKPESPEAALKEKLKEIAPTPVEKAAISQLRRYALAASAGKTEDAIQADAVAEPNEEQITIEFRFISLKEPSAKVFLAHPSLSWSGLPVPKKFVRVEAESGMTGLTTREIDLPSAMTGYGTLSTNIPLPFQARLFEESGAKKLLDIIQSDSKANVLQAPKVTVCSGQFGSIIDVSQSPFVTSVLPVEGDFAVAYQPFIQIFNEGTDIKFKATLLQDRSCRLDYCNATLSKIENVEIVKLLDEGTKKMINGRMEDAGISLQSPNVRTLNLTIPPVTKATPKRCGKRCKKNGKE